MSLSRFVSGTFLQLHNFHGLFSMSPEQDGNSTSTVTARRMKSITGANRALQPTTGLRILPIMRQMSGEPDNSAGMAASDSYLDMPRPQPQAIRNWTQVTPLKQVKALNGFQ